MPAAERHPAGIQFQRTGIHYCGAFQLDPDTNQETLCPGGSPSRSHLSTTSMAIFRCDDNTSTHCASAYTCFAHLRPIADKSAEVAKGTDYWPRVQQSHSLSAQEVRLPRLMLTRRNLPVENGCRAVAPLWHPEPDKTRARERHTPLPHCLGDARSARSKGWRWEASGRPVNLGYSVDIVQAFER